jgi:hypothetical protein
MRGFDASLIPQPKVVNRMFPGLPGVDRRVFASFVLAGLIGVFAGAAPARAGTTDPAPAAALDCGRLAGADAMAALGRLPAPRIINLQGSVPIVTMEPFARFLIEMGYPEASLRDPRDGSLSMSSYASSAKLAGMLAWHYEQTGLRPMLIGHSQGGMLVVRTLHELDGAFADAIEVYDPVQDAALPRTSIRDPYSGAMQPVRGLRVAFGAAIATGALPRLLLGQWSMLPRLRKIPDTVDEFTGFTIAWDPIAGNFGEAEAYAPIGQASVRNVLLPAATSHIGAPLTEHLAADPTTRATIDAWRPDDGAAEVQDPQVDARNLGQAADLWFSIRKHWCVEGQRRVRALGAI